MTIDKKFEIESIPLEDGHKYDPNLSPYGDAECSKCGDWLIDLKRTTWDAVVALEMRVYYCACCKETRAVWLAEDKRYPYRRRIIEHEDP